MIQTRNVCAGDVFATFWVYIVNGLSDNDELGHLKNSITLFSPIPNCLLVWHLQPDIENEKRPNPTPPFLFQNTPIQTHP